MKKLELENIIKEEVSKALNEGYEDQLFLKAKMKQAFYAGWKSAQLPTIQSRSSNDKAFERFWEKQSVEESINESKNLKIKRKLWMP